jgi:outer membrane cobalamin receptor
MQHLPNHFLLRLLFLAASLGLSLAVSAQDSVEKASDDETVDELEVWGRAIDLVGAADSASQGIVGYDDLSTRPILRVGELVEVVPGLIATQHSGGGKANQYFLRGINLDHGTDFSILFEGMPVNMRSHAHGQGYLDMNFIIPELVKTIEYRKGTFTFDTGDFSAAGSTRFTTYDSLDQGFAEAIWGSENFSRLVAGNSWDTAGGTLLLAGELQLSDGPWENEEDTKKLNLFAKYSAEMLGGNAMLMATHYSNDWHATDQIPLREVEAGRMSRFGFIDPSVGGETYRSNIIARLVYDKTSYQLFASRYGMNLFGNPTYFLNDPINGDQIEQEDERKIFGGRVDHVRDQTWGDKRVVLSIGADTRYDVISKLNLFNTSSRERLGFVRNDKVDELSVGGYVDAEINWTNKLRTTVGFRADYYRWDVKAARSENSGNGSDSIVVPRFGIAYNLNDQWEFYANYGGGFHSNDVRAAELSVDPVTGDPADSFEAIVESTGYEAGFRAEISNTLNFTATYFVMELDSELIFVGDAGTTEPNDATERNGVEAAIFWQPTKWLTLDATAAKTDAKFKDAPSDANSIPDAHDTIAGFGATAILDNGLEASLRVRHFGDAPLIEDESVQKQATTLTNFGVSYPVGNLVVGVDVLNVFDVEHNDIEYWYESRVQDEPAGVEDFHFHPVESREIRVNLRYRF